MDLCITKNREAIKEYARDACILWLTVVCVDLKKMWIYYHAWQKTKSVNPHSHMHVRVCARTHRGTPSFPGWTRSDDQWPVFSLHLPQCEVLSPSFFLSLAFPSSPSNAAVWQMHRVVVEERRRCIVGEKRRRVEDQWNFNTVHTCCRRVWHSLPRPMAPVSRLLIVEECGAPHRQCPGAEGRGIAVICRGTRWPELPHQVLPHERGFRLRMIDRFAADSITLSLRQGIRLPGVSADAWHFARQPVLITLTPR